MVGSENSVNLNLSVKLAVLVRSAKETMISAGTLSCISSVPWPQKYRDSYKGTYSWDHQGYQGIK
jgi:hypothetical protein